MYIGLHVKYLLFLSDFNKTSLFFTVFEKYSYIKFHKNLSSGSAVVRCRRMDCKADRQTWRSQQSLFAYLWTRLKKSQDHSLSWLRVKLEMYVDLPDYAEIYVGLHIIFSNTGLCKVQVVPIHALKLYRWSKGTTQFISNLCTRWRYHISRPIRHNFFPEKCDLNSTCVLCTKGKYYFQTYKYSYISKFKA
jgi:hypothetical protein